MYLILIQRVDLISGETFEEDILHILRSTVESLFDSFLKSLSATSNSSQIKQFVRGLIENPRIPIDDRVRELAFCCLAIITLREGFQEVLRFSVFILLLQTSKRPIRYLKTTDTDKITATLIDLEVC